MSSTTAAGIGAALCGALLASTGLASPDGAEWESASLDDGCLSCHLADEPPPEKAALELAGLPATPVPGQLYELIISLRDPELRNAGFLLTLRSATDAAGELQAVDENRVEINPETRQARSTYDGSFVDSTGSTQWRVHWRAPASLATDIRFELWGNAGNRDLSPLGDRIYRRSYTVTH